MRAALWLARGFIKITLVTGMVIEVSMLWCIVLRCIDRPPDNPVSALAATIGSPFLDRFSQVVAPVGLSNGGEFSWMWVGGMALVSGGALLVAWIVGGAHDAAFALLIRAQSLRDRGVGDLATFVVSLFRDPLRAELLYDDPRMSERRDRPPLPPSWRR